MTAYLADPVLVDVAARALYETTEGRLYAVTWAELSDTWRGRYRHRARAVLAALDHTLTTREEHTP